MILIISTYPDEEIIRAIATKLVKSKTVACVNISKINSIYSWKGRIENSPEYIALFKTTIKNKDTLKQKIKETHPYDVPEIVEIDVNSVNQPYHDWLVESTTTKFTR